MTRPMPTMRRAGRPIDPSSLGLDRGVGLMQRSFEPPHLSGDFSSEHGSERADRLVPPETAAHYLRQGECVAEAIMALNDFVRRVMARTRGGGESVRQPFTRAR